MKTIILARVSSEEQMQQDLSIPAQLARAREYAGRKDLEVVNEYQFDESSFKDRREKFEDVVKEIRESKEPVALVVETVDRLQRSFKESVELDKYRKEGKLEIHFIRENLIVHKDSNSSEIQRWDLGVFVAKSYVLQISDNVKRAFEQKLRNGEYPHQAPVGYLNTQDDKDNSDITHDPKRAHFMKRFFELYATGQYSLKTLAIKLEKEGLTSKKTNEPIGANKLHECLKNPFYYGEMKYKDKIYPHKYTPLITKDLFDKCQKVRLSWHKKPFRYAAIPFAFRGLIKCAYCGCTITAEQKKDIYNYYHCTKYRGNCKGLRVKEEDLFAQVEDVLKKLKMPDYVLDDLVKTLKASHEGKIEYNRNSIEGLQKEHRRIQKKLQILYDDRLDGRITTDEYDNLVKEFKQKQENVLTQIQDHDKADENYYLTAPKILTLSQRAYEIFVSSKPEEKRKLLGSLLWNSKLEGKKLSFNLKQPYDSIYLCSKSQLWGG